jgi:sporulation protein YlmC with PRC-barrel domain
MTTFTSYRKAFPFFLILVIITILSGCYSVKTLPKSEIFNADKKYYYIHSGNKSYRLTNISESDGILLGTIDNREVFHSKNKAIRFYIAPDTILKVDETNVSIPLKNVVKVETYRVNGIGIFTTIAGVAGFTLTAALVTYIIAYSVAVHH